MPDSSAPAIRYEREGPVARIVLDRPEQHNALRSVEVDALRTTLDRVDADEDIRVLVLAASGDRTFCAGASLDEMASDGWLVDPRTFGLAEAVMICATDALVGREVINIYDYPYLAGIRMRYETRKSLAETLGEYYPGQRGGVAAS